MAARALRRHVRPARAAGVPAVIHAGEAAGPRQRDRRSRQPPRRADRPWCPRARGPRVGAAVDRRAGAAGGVAQLQRAARHHPTVDRGSPHRRDDRPRDGCVGEHRRPRLLLDHARARSSPSWPSTTGWAPAGWRRLQRRAMAASFAPPEVRTSFEADLTAWESTWGGALSWATRRTRLAAHVLRRLADLPVTIRERPLEGGVDLGTVERRQRQDRPPAHRRPVGGGGEDGGQARRGRRWRRARRPPPPGRSGRHARSSPPPARPRRRIREAGARPTPRPLPPPRRHRGRRAPPPARVRRLPGMPAASSAARARTTGDGSASAATRSAPASEPARARAPSAVARTEGSGSARRRRALTASPWCPATAAARRRATASAIGRGIVASRRSRVRARSAPGWPATARATMMLETTSPRKATSTRSSPVALSLSRRPGPQRYHLPLLGHGAGVGDVARRSAKRGRWCERRMLPRPPVPARGWSRRPAAPARGWSRRPAAPARGWSPRPPAAARSWRDDPPLRR